MIHLQLVGDNYYLDLDAIIQHRIYQSKYLKYVIKFICQNNKSLLMFMFTKRL